MAFIYHNENPENIQDDDCVVRALALFLDDTWDNIYVDLSMQGAAMHVMPSRNSSWMKYLKLNGYNRINILDTCPDCYTIRDFTYDHPKGVFLVGTGQHVVTVIDGNYYDTWDCGNEVPIYYWRKE